VVESGRALVFEGPNYLMAATRTGVRRVPAPVHLAGPDGRIERQLGRFEGGEVSILIEGQRMTASPVPFTSDFFLAARGDRVAAANSAELAVQIYDGEGNLLHTIRQQRNAVEIPDGEFERMMTEALAREQDADARRAAEQRFRQMPRYDTYPAFSSLRFDSEENLWVEDYRARGQTQSRWQVFGRDGALRAYVVVPSGVIVLDISEDAVVGLVRDGSGDRLRLYRLDRGS
jgi:hypothetical protein